MDYKKLIAIYDELLEQIDQYFDRELTQEPRAKANLESYKDELLHELQIELWANHKKKTYDTYDPVKFIWIKAKKVWIAFTRKLEKQSKLKSNVQFEELPEHAFADSFIDDFESKNTIEVIESLLSQSEIELLRYKLQGHSYKEITEMGNYASEDAAKTKFNRLKKLIQIRISRL